MLLIYKIKMNALKSGYSHAELAVICAYLLDAISAVCLERDTRKLPQILVQLKDNVNNTFNDDMMFTTFMITRMNGKHSIFQLIQNQITSVNIQTKPQTGGANDTQLDRIHTWLRSNPSGVRLDRIVVICILVYVLMEIQYYAGMNPLFLVKLINSIFSLKLRVGIIMYHVFMDRDRLVNFFTNTLKDIFMASNAPSNVVVNARADNARARTVNARTANVVHRAVAGTSNSSSQALSSQQRIQAYIEKINRQKYNSIYK